MAAEWLNEQPRNRNFLTPVGFRLDLEIFDGVDFFCQSASIPELSSPFAEVQTPYRNVPIVSSGGTNFGVFTESGGSYTRVARYAMSARSSMIIKKEPDQYIGEGSTTSRCSAVTTEG